jgi:hypothetical protein
MGIPGTDLKCIGQERYVSWFPFNIASYATLAKILEEITLFVALESKVTKMRSFL